MYARLMMLTVKPGKRHEAITHTENVLLPLLSKQKGFVDFVGLDVETSQDDLAGLFFWATKNDSEAFAASPQFKQFMEKAMPLLERIDAYSYNVGASTFHKISKGVAVA
jgi:heme-degrading monooxygenase HmoA